MERKDGARYERAAICFIELVVDTANSEQSDCFISKRLITFRGESSAHVASTAVTSLPKCHASSKIGDKSHSIVNNEKSDLPTRPKDHSALVVTVNPGQLNLAVWCRQPRRQSPKVDPQQGHLPDETCKVVRKATQDKPGALLSTSRRVDIVWAVGCCSAAHCTCVSYHFQSSCSCCEACSTFRTANTINDVTCQI